MAESYDLKLDRADHHLKELKAEIRRFTKKHAYEAVPVAGSNRKTRTLRYKLRFTEQPSEMLPVIVGDIIHNIRSALDHLIVANVPRVRRWDASFPIFKKSPFGPDGELLDGELGKSWGLPRVWLTSLLPGCSWRKGWSHAEEVPRRVQA